VDAVTGWLLLAAVALLALGLPCWRWGSRGLVAAALALAAGLGALLGRRGRTPGPPPPVGGQSGEAARRTAGDILRERHAEEQARIAAAADPGNPDRLDDLAARGNTRRRR